MCLQVEMFLVMLAGAFIWVLDRYLGRENLIVAEASLLTGASLVTGLDISGHVQALLDGFTAGFHFLVLKV